MPCHRRSESTRREGSRRDYVAHRERVYIERETPSSLQSYQPNGLCIHTYTYNNAVASTYYTRDHNTTTTIIPTSPASSLHLPSSYFIIVVVVVVITDVVQQNQPHKREKRTSQIRKSPSCSALPFNLRGVVVVVVNVSQIYTNVYKVSHETSSVKVKHLMELH